MKTDTNIQISISNLASILNVHQRTLRIWDEEGVLIPTRSNGNQRFYKIEEIKKAELVLFLTRNLGINLAGVKIIFKLLDKINPPKPKEYIKATANDVGIDEKLQQDNLRKNLKRGRKKKNSK